MGVCLCYHDEQNFLHERGVCYGTKEKEPCSCGGNPVKCDFYEEVREKYIHRTNYDRIISKSVEELAKFMGELPCCPPGADVKELCYPMDACEGTDLQVQCWLDWLKQEVSS